VVQESSQRKHDNHDNDEARVPAAGTMSDTSSADINAQAVQNAKMMKSALFRLDGMERTP
jgi:hypothetical protein